MKKIKKSLKLKIKSLLKVLVKRKVFILLLCVFFIFILIISLRVKIFKNYYFPNKEEKQEQSLSLSDRVQVNVKVLNFNTLEPIKGVVVSIPAKNTGSSSADLKNDDEKDLKPITMSKQGIFSFSLSPKSFFYVQGPNFPSTVKVNINDRRNITILFDKNLYETLFLLKKYEEQRKYKALYTLLSKRVKSKYNENSFSDMKNKVYNQKVDKNIKLEVSPRFDKIEKQINEKATIVIEYRLSESSSSASVHEVKVPLVYEDNWKIDSDLSVW